jgi:hypothetical protein
MKQLLTLLLLVVLTTPALAQTELAEPRHKATYVADSLAKAYRLSEGRLIQLRSVEVCLSQSKPLPEYARVADVSDAEMSRFLQAVYDLRQRYSIALYRGY